MIQRTGQDSGKSPELFAVRLQLKPLKEGVIPLAHGYHASALFLSIIRASSPEMSQSLHADESFKPFTVSTLTGRMPRRGAELQIKTENLLYLDVTFMNSSVFSHFMDGAVKWGGDPLHIAGVPFKVEEVNTAGGSVSPVLALNYAELMEQAKTSRKIDMEFLSPTVFRSGGKRNVVFPEPSLVFGSYFNKWQALASCSMEEDLPHHFNHINVTRYRLKTVLWDFGSYQEIGFYGTCRFELSEKIPSEIVQAVNVLADFARFCGTGAKTTMGMGQTRRLGDAGVMPHGN